MDIPPAVTALTDDHARRLAEHARNIADGSDSTQLAIAVGEALEWGGDVDRSQVAMALEIGLFTEADLTK